MRTILLISVLFFFFQITLHAQVSTHWDARFGGTDGDGCYGLVQTPDGGYLLAGTSASSPSGDKTAPCKGAFDYGVVKMGPDGTKQWDKSFGGSGYEELWTIQPANGGYLLGGYSLSTVSGDKTEPSWGGADYWVVWMDAEGAVGWDKRFGGTNADELTVITPASDGNFLLGGFSFSGFNGDKTQTSRGGYDYWVVKMDPNGHKLWDKRFGGPGYDFLYDMHPTSDGGFLLAGHSNSGVGGDKSQPSQGTYDYWIIKIDEKGNKLWDKTFGGSSLDYCYGVEVTADNTCLLAGYSYSEKSGDKTAPSQGGADFWVVGIDAQGEKIWDQAYGGSRNDRLYNLEPTPDGRFLLVGDSNSDAGCDKTESSRGDFDGWVVEIDPSGNWYWDKTLGGSGPDYFLPALALPGNGYLLCGGSKSGVTGDKTLSNRGGWDFWMVKTTANCVELDIIVEPELTPVTCLDAADGSIFVAVTGGTAPYTYTWSTGEESSSIVNQTAGLYSLTIEEASGCKKTIDFEIGVLPIPLEVQLMPCQTVFSGYKDAFNCTSLIPQVSGGCPPYSYFWSTGETREEITVCPATSTIYSLTVADQAGQEWVALTEVEVLDVRCGNNLDQVLVCQAPPGNPENTRTLCVAPEDVSAILSAGGYLGPCDWENCAGSVGRAIAGGKLDPNLILGRATGWEEPEPQPLLSLFPNPAGDFLVADLRFFPEGKYDISIFNETGKMLISQKVEIPGSIGWHIDLRTYPSGLYWLQVRGEELLVNEKFVVKSVSQ